jgi:hypothetical protein
MFKFTGRLATGAGIGGIIGGILSYRLIVRHKLESEALIKETSTIIKTTNRI